MSNLKLVPDDPTPLEKLLLDASRAETPSEDHKARMRAVLGIGLPSGSLASPTGAGTSPTAAPSTQVGASMPPAATAAAANSAAAAKVALGASFLAVLGALWLMAERDVTPRPAQPIIVAVKPDGAPTPPAAIAPPRPTLEGREVRPLPPLEESGRSPRARSATSAVSAADDLSEQIRLIEAARAGVASHSERAALTALDTYSARFPRGSFVQEAMVLRIRALEQSGDSARATVLAKAFVSRFPNSPHVARLQPIAVRGAPR